jgi:hypothetical protein
MSNLIDLVAIKLNPKSLGPRLDWTSKENDYSKEVFLLIVCQMLLPVVRVSENQDFFKLF